MSQTIYSDTHTSISDLFGDGPLFTAPLETTTGLDYPRVSLAPFRVLGPSGATPSYQYDLVQSIESPPPLVVSGHGFRSDEDPQGLSLTGPYSAMGNPNYPPPVSYTGNVGIDDLPHPTTGLAGHHGDQTHDNRHHIPIGPGPPRLEYYSPMTPDLNNDDPLGHMPLVDNVAGPSLRSPSPMRSRMSDDENENLKRLATQYLNNPDSYVSDIRVRRRRSGGREISVILEIDD